MKSLSFTALALLPATICAGCAAYLAAHNLPGWGWFIFGTWLVYPNLRTGKAAELHEQRKLEESRREAA